MTSNELAKEIIERASRRVLSHDAKQYDVGKMQLFEVMEEEDLLDMAIDELLDNINYSVMTIIRFEEMKRRIALLADKY